MPIFDQPKTAKKPRDWSTGLCGCYQDCNTLCYACWCFPCLLCTLSKNMDECATGPCCCGIAGGSCLAYAGMHIPGAHLPNVFLVALRTKLRIKHGIKGSICRDVCCVWCCEFCVAAQLARELKHLQA